MNISKGNRSGFTLLELLVAMVLFSMVTLMIAMAIKIAIHSWDRGIEEGENIQRWVAIPSLIKKQLGSLVKKNPFENAFPKQLPFSGKKQALSFFTSYAPQGSPWQGLIRTTYLFNKEKKTLYLYQQIVTRKKDLRAEQNPLSDQWNDTFRPISIVHGITEFNLFYTGLTKPDPRNPDDWKETWEENLGLLPTALGLNLQMKTGIKAKSGKWYFNLGGTALFP